MMRGISKSKHEHLIEALLQLEKLLEVESGTFHKPGSAIENLNDVKIDATYKSVINIRVELEEIFSTYNIALESLAFLIDRYEELYNYSRTEHLAKILKELKRKISNNDDQFQLMRDNIQTVYRTWVS